jgi:predicted nucleotidyltransferase
LFDADAAAAVLSQVVSPVLAELRATYPSLPPLMVVGSICRDSLHAGLGHRGTLRRTDDLDIALALDGWHHFDELVSRLERVRSTSRVRFAVADHVVDIIPFGDAVEAPPGTVTPAARGDESMSVLGFRETYGAAMSLRLESGIVRVPTVAGFALLKLKAWIDRAPTGQYKDAADLATAMFWYQDDDAVTDRLYGDDLAVLTAADFESGEAAVALLARDALALLDRGARQDLVEAWRASEPARRLLADNLDGPALPRWPRRGEPDRLRYADRLARSIEERGRV